MKTNTVSNLALAAAFAGLLGGTAVRLNAQPLAGHTGHLKRLAGYHGCDG